MQYFHDVVSKFIENFTSRSWVRASKIDRHVTYISPFHDVKISLFNIKIFWHFTHVVYMVGFMPFLSGI